LLFSKKGTGVTSRHLYYRRTQTRSAQTLTQLFNSTQSGSLAVDALF